MDILFPPHKLTIIYIVHVLEPTIHGRYVVFADFLGDDYGRPLLLADFSVVFTDALVMHSHTCADFSVTLTDVLWFSQTSWRSGTAPAIRNRRGPPRRFQARVWERETKSPAKTRKWGGGTREVERVSGYFISSP